MVDLFAAGPDVYRFRAGRSLGYFENILDILACLRPHRDEPFDALAGDVTQEISHINSATVILLTWNETRRQVLEELIAAGVEVKAILVAAGDRPSNLPPHIMHLTADDIRSGGSDRF